VASLPYAVDRRIPTREDDPSILFRITTSRTVTRKSNPGSKLTALRFALYAFALYADERVLGEHGRAILPATHNQTRSCGSFYNVPQLERAIEDYIAGHNAAPTPFTWTAKADDIVEKVKRGRAALNKLQSATL